MKNDTGSDCSVSSVIREVTSYISRSTETELPADVIIEAKHHILDTLAAIVSGSQLKPGQLAKKYIMNQSGVNEAQIIGTQKVSSAINAAFANAIMAHSDETDDSHTMSRLHAGCSIVPSALALSEREGVDGTSFLRSVVAGYDIGCRITMALGVFKLRQMSRCTHGIGGNFGSAAASAAVLRLDDEKVRYVLSYAAQQASGLTSWMRDQEHIEKAFVFGGMPARNGTTAAILVQSGFTGVRDVFSGEHNFFEAFSPDSRPELLAEGLGSRYEIMFTNIKKFPVGSPILAALDALLLLMEKHGITSKDTLSIIARLPGDTANVVNNRDMPDINLQYLLAVTLLDGNLSFEAAHNYKRMNDPAVLALRKCITLVEDPELPKDKRQAIVEVTTKDGAKLREHVIRLRGTPENPMTTKDVEKKCRMLMIPVLGEERSRELISKILRIEQINNMRELRPLLSMS